MDDVAALRRTVRRCTAALVVFLVPALEALSSYQYEGTPFFAAALAYLVVSFGLALFGTDDGPGTDENSGADGAPNDGSGDGSAAVRSDAGG